MAGSSMGAAVSTMSGGVPKPTADRMIKRKVSIGLRGKINNMKGLLNGTNSTGQGN